MQIRYAVLILLPWATAATLRYLIARKPLSRGAAFWTSIALWLAMVMATSKSSINGSVGIEPALIFTGAILSFYTLRKQYRTAGERAEVASLGEPGKK